MKLYARTLGEQGPDLIVMHGVFGMSDNWQSLGKRWSDRFRVHLLDMRNHGRSPHSTEFTYPLMAEDLSAYLEEAGLSSAHLLGHSMGGKVAMYFAGLWPEKTESLMVADIGPKAYPPHHQWVIDALSAVDPKEFASRREAQEKFGSNLPEGVRQFLLKSLYWKEENQLDWRFNWRVIARELVKDGEPLPSHYRYEGPCLFVRGGRSDYLLNEDWPGILRQFPQAELQTLEGAGHWLHAEKPREFEALVRHFLSA